MPHSFLLIYASPSLAGSTKRAQESQSVDGLSYEIRFPLHYFRSRKSFPERRALSSASRARGVHHSILDRE